MRLLSLICLLCFISFNLNAQNDFLETSCKLNGLVVNELKNEIIYANDTHVYYVDYKSLKIKDSIKIVSSPNTYINKLEYLNTPNPIVIIKTKTKNKYYTEFYEYPEDSIYYYNVSLKSIVKKLPGNLFATFNIKNPIQSVVAFNQIYKYTNTRTREIVNGAKKGSLQTLPEKNEAESNGIIRNLKMNSKGTEVAIVYYDSIGKNYKYHYTLELRSLPTLEVRKSIPIIGRVTSIQFSENDKYLVLKKDYENNSTSSISVDEDVDVYQSSSLNKLTEIPKDLFIENLIENGSIWKNVKSEIINQTYGTEEVLNKIWSNLTPFSAIDGFLKINKDELLIYGNKGYGFSGKKNGIYKYSLSNNAIFSENSKVATIDTLFQQNEVIISNNKVSGFNPQLNRNKNVMLLHNENKIEIWSTLDKRKLYDLEFNNTINPFLNQSGNSSLIFQTYEGKSYNEFTMSFLDLTTGIVNTKLFIDSNFNALQSKCFNIDEDLGNWLCSDGTDKLWKLNSKNKTIESLSDYANPNYYRTNIEVFKRIPETNKALISIKSVNVAPNHSVTDSKFEGFKIYDSNKNTITDISNLKENDQVFPVAANDFIYQKGSTLKVYDLINESSKKIGIYSGYNISKIVTHKNRANIILKSSEKYAVDSLLVLEYNLETKAASKSFKIPYSKDHFINDDGFYYKESDRFYNYSSALDESVAWNNPKSLFTQSTDLSLSIDGKMLFKNEWLFNLKTLELEVQIPGFYNSIVLNNNQLFYLEKETYDTKKPFFQFKIGEQNNLKTIHWASKKFSMEAYDGPNVTLCSKGKKFVLAYETNEYNGQTLYLINLVDKTVTTKKIKFHLKSAKFSDDENNLVLLKETNNFPPKKNSLIFNTTTFKLVSEIEVEYSNHFNPNTILHTDGEYLIKSIVNGNEVIKSNSYFARRQLTLGKYIASKSLIVAGSDEGELLFWNPDNQSPIKTIKVSNSEVLKIEEINNSLFILSKDSEISIVNLDSLELEAMCSFFDNDKTISMAWFTPDGYFKASKNDIRNFHFVKNGKTFPLLDYSLFLNRPDVLMQKIGFTPESVYSVYKKAYLKRLSRNNYTENTDFLNINRPNVVLSNRAAIASITNKKNLLLEIKNISNADELMIYINGVPVLQEQIKDKNLISKEIILNNGRNRVSIITKSEAGIESDPITFETKNVMPRPKSKVYYVGIGVSKYRDSSMNLKYADKDVRRLANVFASEYEGRIEIDTLLNQNVTKAKIIALKSKLKETSIDDTVIISFSGHGLIGDNNKFYFGVHDIDFDNPKANGLNYQDIQNLLTNIPARRKLLLLDACHSGELDSSENTESNLGIDKKVTQNIPEGAKGSNAKSTTANNDDTFQLMQSLFYDLDRGNGSFVISAAAGSEFAYEDEKWGNGVFTYSFINALYDLGYDTWKGEMGIPISKIKKYVYDNVKKLTNNKQQPTSRAENLEWDWVLE